MTLFKAQRVIKSMRFNLSLTNAGLDKLDEKRALDLADTLIENELIKEKGCDYCNTNMIKSMIGYKYMNFCPRCGKRITQ